MFSRLPKNSECQAMDSMKESLKNNSHEISKRLPFNIAKERCNVLYDTFISGKEDFQRLLIEEQEWKKEKEKLSTSTQLADKHDKDFSELKEDVQNLQEVSCIMGEAVDDLQKERIENLDRINSQARYPSISHPGVSMPTSNCRNTSHGEGHSPAMPVNTLLKELNEKVLQERKSKEVLQGSLFEMRFKYEEMSNKVVQQANQIGEQQVNMSRVTDAMNMFRTTSEKAKSMEQELSRQLLTAREDNRKLNDQVVFMKNDARIKEETIARTSLECDKVVSDNRKLLAKMCSLQTDVKDLQSTIKTYEENLKTLASAQKKQKKLEVELVESERCLAQTVQNLNYAQETQKELESKLYKFELDLANSEAVRSQQNKEIIKLTEKLHEQNISATKNDLTIDAYHNHVAELTQEINTMSADVLNLKNGIEQATCESETAKEQLRLTYDDIRRLQVSSCNAEMKLKQQKGEEVKLKGIIDRKERKITDLEKEVQKYGSLVREYSGEIDELESEIKCMHTKWEITEKDNERSLDECLVVRRMEETKLRSMIELKDKKIVELQKELEKYETLLDQNRKELKSLREEINTANGKLKLVERESKILLQEKNETHQEEETKLKETINVKDKQISIMETELQRYSVLVESNNTEISILYNNLKDMAKEVESAHDKTKLAEQDITKLQKESSNYVTEQKNEMEKLKVIANGKNTKVVDMERELEKYKVLIKANKSEITTLYDSLKEMGTELQAERRNYNLLVEEKENLREDLTEKHEAETKWNRMLGEKDKKIEVQETALRKHEVLVLANNKQVAILREHLKEMECEIRTLQQRLKQKEEDNNRLNKEAADYLVDLRQEYNQRITTITTEKEETTSILITELQHKLTESKFALERTTEELYQVKTTLHMEMQEMEVRLVQSTTIINSLQLEKEDLSRQQADEEEIERLQLELEEARKEISKLKKKCKKVTIFEGKGGVPKKNDEELKRIRTELDWTITRLDAEPPIPIQCYNTNIDGNSMKYLEKKIHSLRNELDRTLRELEMVNAASRNKDKTLMELTMELEDSRRRLETKTDELRGFEVSLENKAEALRKSAKEISTIKCSMQSQLHLSQEEIQSVKVLLDTKYYELTKLQVDLDEANEDLSIKTAELVAERGRYGTASTRTTNCQQTVKKLEEVLENTKKEHEKLQQVSTKKSEQLLKVQMELDETCKQLEITREQLKEAEVIIKEKAEALHKASKDLISAQLNLQNDLNKTKGELKRKENVHMELENTKQELRHVEQTSCERQKALDEVKNELNKTYQQLEKKSEELHVAEIGIKKKTEALCQASKDLVNVQDDLQIRLNKTENELKSSRQRFDEGSNCNKALEMELEKSLKELLVVKQRHEMQKIALEELSEELEETWDELKGKSGELQKAQYTIKEKQDVLEKIQKDFAMAKEIMQVELYETRRGLDSVQKELETKQTLCSQLESTLREVEAIKISTAELSKELDGVKKELDSSRENQTVSLGGFIWMHVGILDKCVKELAKVQANVRKSHENLLTSEMNLTLKTEALINQNEQDSHNKGRESLLEKVMQHVNIREINPGLNNIREVNQAVQMSLQEELEATKEELNYLKSNLSEKKCDLAKVQNELENTSYQLQNKTEEMQTKEESVKKKIEDLFQVKDNLQTRLEIAHNEIEAKKNDLEVKEALKAELIDTKDELERTKLAAAEQTEILASLKRELEAARKGPRKSVGKTKDALVTSLRELTKVQEELDNTRTELIKIKAERSTIVKDFDILTTEYEKDKQSMNSLHSEIKYLQVKVSNATQFEEESQKLTKELEMKEKEQEHFIKQIQQLEALVKTLQSNNEELTRKLQLKEEDYEDCLQKINRENEKIKHKLTKRKSEMSSMRQKLIEFHNLIENQETERTQSPNSSSSSRHGERTSNSVDDVLKSKKHRTHSDKPRRNTEPSTLKKSLLNSLIHKQIDDDSLKEEGDSETEKTNGNSSEQEQNDRRISTGPITDLFESGAIKMLNEALSKRTSSSEDSDEADVKAAVDAILACHGPILPDDNKDYMPLQWSSSSDSDEIEVKKKTLNHVSFQSNDSGLAESFATTTTTVQERIESFENFKFHHSTPKGSNQDVNETEGPSDKMAEDDTWSGTSESSINTEKNKEITLDSDTEEILKGSNFASLKPIRSSASGDANVSFRQYAGSTLSLSRMESNDDESFNTSRQRRNSKPLNSRESSFWKP